MNTEENDNVKIDDSAPESSAVESTPAPKVEPRLASEPKGEKSIRHLLKKSIDTINKEDEEVPLTNREKREAAKKTPPKEVEAEKAAKPVSPVTEKKESTEVIPPVEAKLEQPQATGLAPPTALTKEEKAVWESLPEVIQKAFIRREADTQKGIDQLKAKYQPIEDVLAPVKPLLQQNGLTEAHAVKQLFDWHRALASPNKASQISAFKALAQSHGLDINLLAPKPIQPPAPQNVESSPTQTANDPLAQLQPLLEQTLNPIQQRLANYEAEIQRQKLEAANNELANFSKDKPHFEKVRTRMAEILTTAAQFGRPVSLQQAYDEAVWSMADVRSELLNEQEEKRQKELAETQRQIETKLQEEAAERQKREAELEAKRKEIEALERARKASVSPRSTAPVGQVSSQRSNKPQSVADTLRSVLKDSRANI